MVALYGRQVTALFVGKQLPMLSKVLPARLNGLNGLACLLREDDPVVPSCFIAVWAPNQRFQLAVSYYEYN